MLEVRQMVEQLGIVHRRITRANQDAVERLSRLGVATIHEAQDRTGLMQPCIRPVWPGARLGGTAVTVLLQPGDNWMLHVAAEQVREGDIVVAGCLGDSIDGFFGELLAISFKARGARGLVIDAGVRDVDALEAMQFPVFSRAINARGTVKNTLGSVNVPVVCGGMLVTPGDVVVGDTDGVVVVSRAAAEDIAARAQAREDNEDDKRKIFAAGTLGLDHYKMRERLEKAGLKYVD
jgi:4-hydroxy-4-methyl-2-oxoglutarate aldolase